MSSPLALIREGITAGDWQKVCDGFALISGEKLETPACSKTVALMPDGFLDTLRATLGEELDKRRVPVKPVRKPADLDDDEEDDEEEDEGENRTFLEEDDEEEEEEEEEEKAPPPSKKPKPKPRKRPGKLDWEEDEEEPEQEEDPVSARARQVRDERRGVVDNTDKFRIQHGKPQGGGGSSGNACRVEPFVPGMKNKFKDTGALAAKDIKDSKKFSKRKEPEERRPPAKKVKVTCCKCNNDFKVEPIFAPKNIDKSDKSSFVCNGCQPKGRK